MGQKITQLATAFTSPLEKAPLGFSDVNKESYARLRQQGFGAHLTLIHSCQRLEEKSAPRLTDTDVQPRLSGKVEGFCRTTLKPPKLLAD